MTRLMTFMMLFLFKSSTFSQTEIPLIGLKYDHIFMSSYYDAQGELIPSTASRTDLFETEINYGTPIGKGNELSCSVSFTHRKISRQESFLALPTNVFLPFYVLPSHEVLMANLNLETLLQSNWSWINSFNTTAVDDFFKSNLDPILLTGFSSMLEKQKSNAFSYGGGIFVSQFKKRLLITPLLTLTINNDKSDHGIEFIFPERLKLWKSISASSYLAFEANFQSYSVLHSDIGLMGESIRNDVSIICTSLNYFYIYEDFIRFTIGVGLPIRYYSLTNGSSSINISQTRGLLLEFGISLTSPNN